MKYIYSNRLFICIFFILLVVCTIFLPNNDFPQYASDDKIPCVEFFKGTFYDSSIMLPSTPYKLSYNANTDFNNIFGINETAKFVFGLQLALQVLIIDRRKQIIASITSHFEGGKYKDSLSLI